MISVLATKISDEIERTYQELHFGKYVMRLATCLCNLTSLPASQVGFSVLPRHPGLLSLSMKGSSFFYAM